MNFYKILLCVAALNVSLATGFGATLAPSAQPAVTATAAPGNTNAAPGNATAAATRPGSNPAAASDIRDIRGPISIPYGWLWAAYVAGGMVLAAALYFAWRWYRLSAKEPPKQPHEIALERLEKARALLTPAQAREYSFAVSEITRTYIEARFQERANRRTTEEFLRDLLGREETGLSAHRALLEDFLRYCDLAKFARWQLSLPDMESMHESARAFILETQPPPAHAVFKARGPQGAAAPSANPQLSPARP